MIGNFSSIVTSILTECLIFVALCQTMMIFFVCVKVLRVPCLGQLPTFRYHKQTMFVPRFEVLVPNADFLSLCDNLALMTGSIKLPVSIFVLYATLCNT